MLHWARMLAYVTGTVAQELLARNECLAAENRILKAQLKGRLGSGVTGDYSRGATGFWIENGQPAYPGSEVTITGNPRDMFRTPAPASDLQFRFGTDAPTVRIEGMAVAGK